ncbi:GNAT family N-acetyltransferase [Anaerocolumna sp.]|uniref:GNAT family N-acetyltransferase n=1 Tax=Anaerocolumna sp. TaxID=2041569 RepID=UPI0028AA4DD1|nr:GNAT family protein [Anaerocolumna sp.]
MQIHKENLTIRSATVEDAKVLTNWWNDGTIMAHAGFPKGLNQSIEETIAQIKENETRLSQRCIIEVNGIRAGEMSYGIGGGFAEIGIKICEVSYQNCGIGTKLLNMLIEFLFTDDAINSKVKIEKILLDTNLKNEKAQHVYGKIGFTKVRVNKDAWENQLGEMQSSVDYEMTRKQFQKLFLNSK